MSPCERYLLASGELELGSAESLDNVLLVAGFGADRHDHLTNSNTGHGAQGFTESTPHPCLEPVSPSAGQHLVDTDDMEGVQTDPDVETVFSTSLHHVLVGTDTGCLQSFRGQLLVLVRDHVTTQRELIHPGFLPAQVKDPDLRIRHTATETGLGVGLVLAVAVAEGERWFNQTITSWLATATARS